MKEKKRSKKPFIFSAIGVLLVVVIAVSVYIQHEQNQKEEIWALRDTLDTTYFPLRDEFEACVYPSKTTSKEYDCYKQDLIDKSQKVRERISNYEVISDDAKRLKNEVLNGVDIIDKTAKDLDASDTTEKAGTLSADEVKEIANHISNLTDDKKVFYKNVDKIYNILVPEYYQK